MKKQFRSLVAIFLVLAILFAFAACTKDNKWDSAIYREDRVFGEGEITITVSVVVDENRVTFTVNTDKTTLADALLEHNLIEGEESTYGLYLEKVNGITADYNVDGSWWNVKKDGKSTPVGISYVEIQNGDTYELVCEK